MMRNPSRAKDVTFQAATTGSDAYVPEYAATEEKDTDEQIQFSCRVSSKN